MDIFRSTGIVLNSSRHHPITWIQSNSSGIVHRCQAVGGVEWSIRWDVPSLAEIQQLTTNID